MAQRRHIVFLIHGIRTQGEWLERAVQVLESDPTIRARPVRYGFFDLVRFLLPFSTFRRQPVRRITDLIRDELSKNPKYFSVIAHASVLTSSQGSLSGKLESAFTD
jgi:hypothetical protein